MNIESVKSLSVERVSGLDAWAGLATEWEVLDKEIYPRTPFTSPLWMDVWWKHFQRHNLLFRDEFFGHVVRDADGRLVAVVPLMRTYCLGLRLPVMRMVQFFGNDPALTELRGVICRPGDHDRVIQILVEHFLRHRGEWDVFRWNGLRHAASAYTSLPPGCEFIARREMLDYILDVPRSWDELKASVSGNMRKNLRKAYEFLERDGFSYTLRVAERPEDVQAAIEQFLLLHAVRSEATDMILHPNKFERPHTRAFLVEYLQKLAERKELLIFELDVGSKVVASRLTFLLGSELYLYFAGYDTSLKQYSVMTILMAEIIKWAIANGIKRVNLSTGNDQSKLRWKPVEIVFHDAIQISATLRGKIFFPGFLAYEALLRVRATRAFYQATKNISG